jgi:hypothetical protein
MSSYSIRLRPGAPLAFPLRAMRAEIVDRLLELGVQRFGEGLQRRLVAQQDVLGRPGLVFDLGSRERAERLQKDVGETQFDRVANRRPADFQQTPRAGAARNRNRTGLQRAQQGR